MTPTLLGLVSIVSDMKRTGGGKVTFLIYTILRDLFSRVSRIVLKLGGARYENFHRVRLHLSDLHVQTRIVLIGHSMGGIVIKKVRPLSFWKGRELKLVGIYVCTTGSFTTRPRSSNS